MKQHQQFFTPASLGRDLLSSIPEPGASIADFTAGEGALIAAAADRWPDANFYALEIDPRLKTTLDSALPQANSVIGSAYSYSDLFKLNLKPESLGLVVGNPPFTRKILDDYSRNLIRPFIDVDRQLRKTVRAEALYLAVANFYLKPGGYISIILPTGFIYGERNQGFWQAFLDMFDCLRATPNNTAFPGAQVRTSSLIFRKRCSDHPAPNNVEWAKRLRSSHREVKTNVLEDYAPDIRRGRASSSDGRSGNALHTTHLANKPTALNLTEIFTTISNAPKNAVWCKPGDIVVSRVGTRCIGRLALITSGTAPITDCLFRVRLDSTSGNASFRSRELFQQMSDSEISRQALQLNTGSCAAYMTKKQLLKIQLSPYDPKSTK